jgi:hypothetical protein
MAMTATVTTLSMLAVFWITFRSLAPFIDRSIDRDLPEPRWLDTGQHR